MKTKLKKWKTVSSDLIFANTYFRVYKDVVRLPDGKKYDYFLSDRNGRGVLILPVDRHGRILLAKEYRYPVNKVLYEIVGGALKKHEQPLAGAKRELKEETGYTARRFRPLGTFYASPARNDTMFYVYLAYGLTPGRPQPEDMELLETEFLSRRQIAGKIRAGEIKEPYFLVSYLLYTLKR